MPNPAYDLHIHSCLSPCGDDEMTPANIVGMAAVKELGLIAVTDHSTCKNCGTVLRLAEEYGVLAMPGMELTTAEEVHVVCLFEDLHAAMDFDGELTREQLDEVEDEANRIIYENVAITAEYPSADVLRATEYRSKLDLTENVRLVTIGDYDVCACCAPHVARTGEIGMIKLLDAIRYKGGMRIHFLAGSAALAHYRQTWQDVAALSAMMSVRQNEVVEGLKKKDAELDRRGATIAALRRQLLDYKIAALEKTDGNLCIFTDDPDMLSLRLLVNAGVEKCTGICAAFSGNDTDGYRYIMGAHNTDLRSLSKQINAALGGKGGGSAQMIQGSCTATQGEIRAYIEQL